MFSRKIELKLNRNANVLFRRCNPGAASVRGKGKQEDKAILPQGASASHRKMPAQVALRNITVLGDETVPQVNAWGCVEGRQGNQLLGPHLSSFPVIEVHHTSLLSMLDHITCSLCQLLSELQLALYSAAFNLG